MDVNHFDNRKPLDKQKLILQHRSNPRPWERRRSQLTNSSSYWSAERLCIGAMHASHSVMSVSHRSRLQRWPSRHCKASYPVRHHFGEAEVPTRWRWKKGLRWSKAAPKQQIEMLNFLLDQGLNINKVEYEDDSGLPLHYASKTYGTSLHYAAAWGYEDRFELLLRRGSWSECACVWLCIAGRM